MTTPLTTQDVERVVAEYDRIVRLNTDLGAGPTHWDAMAQVAVDLHGEVMFEVLDTANDLGFVDLISGEVDRLQDAADLYREALRVEVGPDRISAVRGRRESAKDR